MRIVASLMIVAAVLGLAITSAFATSEDAGWSRTTRQEAIASFTIEHRVDLITEGSVQITESLRWGRNTAGVEVIDTVNLQAELLLCQKEGCRTVWTVKGEMDPSEVLLHIDSDSADLQASLPVTVEVHDFNDADRDGDRDEVTASFAATVPVAVSWTADGDPSSSCSWKAQQNGTLVERQTTQEALSTGSLSGQNMNPVSSRMSQTDDTIYAKSPFEDPCA